jgi:hypothetical protein
VEVAGAAMKIEAATTLGERAAGLRETTYA